MKGLHLAFPVGNPHQESHDPMWNASGQKGENDDPLSHEEYCVSVREKFLLSYFDQFQYDIEKLRPEVSQSDCLSPRSCSSLSFFLHLSSLLCRWES
jgi:hypothetical protein